MSLARSEPPEEVHCFSQSVCKLSRACGTALSQVVFQNRDMTRAEITVRSGISQPICGRSGQLPLPSGLLVLFPEAPGRESLLLLHEIRQPYHTQPEYGRENCEVILRYFLCLQCAALSLWEKLEMPMSPSIRLIGIIPPRLNTSGRSRLKPALQWLLLPSMRAIHVFPCPLSSL